MAKTSLTGDNRIAEMEGILRKMSTKKGYDLDTTFKGFIDYLLWMFDPEGTKPDVWRFDTSDAKMFYDAAVSYFKLMDEVL